MTEQNDAQDDDGFGEMQAPAHLQKAVETPANAPAKTATKSRSKTKADPKEPTVKTDTGNGSAEATMEPNAGSGVGETVASLRRAGSVTIFLDHNDNIPPTGLFVSVNGVGYNIVPGKEVNVPKPVLEVLNNAVQSRPVIEDGRIVGYQDSLRFPYRRLD